MKELLEFIVSQLVEKPGKIKIKESVQNESVILELEVDSDDIGKVIGKKGKIIRAIRTLLYTRAIKEGKKVQVILGEPKEVKF